MPGCDFVNALRRLSAKVCATSALDTHTSPHTIGRRAGARSLGELKSIVEPMREESGPLPEQVVHAIDTAWQDIVGGHAVYPTRDLPDFARL